MPLSPGNSRGIVSRNIREMMAAGHPQRQAIAAALSNARRHAHGGIVRRDIGGGLGISAPPITQAPPAANPYQANQVSQLSALPDEKLQELTMRAGSSPLGQTAQRLLQARRMGQAQQPQQQQQGSAPVTPPAPSIGLPQGMQGGVGLRRGGGIAHRDMGGPMSGGPMSVSPDALDAISWLPTGAPMMSGKGPAPANAKPPPPSSGTGGQGGGIGGDLSSLASMAKIASMFSKGGGIAHRDVGGMSPSMESPWWTRSEDRGMDSGFLSGSTPGRADQLLATAPSGSYIIPADVVAGLGEGNSLAGARVMDEMLHTLPYGISSAGMPRSKQPPEARANTSVRREYNAKGGGVQAGPQGQVPVALSHGEYHISPGDVVRIGKGDMKRGHKILDAWVVHERKKIIDKMKSLKGPVKE